MENIIAGIQLATTPEALIAIFIGLIAGQILGAIPGLTASMAVALLVPYTFYLDPWIGIPMLLGMFKGSLFGSSITAILIKTLSKTCLLIFFLCLLKLFFFFV